MSVDPLPSAAGQATSVPAAPAADEEDVFDRLLSGLNPLQYLPVIGTIYRAVTGDRPEPAFRLGGAAVAGALVGGPVGIVTSLIGVGLEELFYRVVDEAADEAPDPAVRQRALAAYEGMGTWDVPAGGNG